MQAMPPEILQEAVTLFHDVRTEDIDPEAHSAFVISRVLDRGTLRSVSALMNLYGLERIRSFFLEGGGDQVSRRTLALWREFLGLSEEECTSKSSPRIRSPYWTD
jgi:hypothetical protein